MGKITEENRRELENADRFEDAVLTGMIDHEFSAELGRLIEQKGVSVVSIVENSSVSKSYINKLRNFSEKTATPSRHVIIDLALALDASLDETNYLLKLARYQELYTRDKTEALIIWGMAKELPGARIREMLHERGLDHFYKEK